MLKINSLRTVLRLSRKESLAYLSYRLFTNVFNVVGLVVARGLCENTSKYAATLVNDIIIASTNHRIRERVVVFIIYHV